MIVKILHEMYYEDSSSFLLTLTEAGFNDMDFVEIVEDIMYNGFIAPYDTGMVYIHPDSIIQIEEVKNAD